MTWNTEIILGDVMSGAFYSLEPGCRTKQAPGSNCALLPDISGTAPTQKAISSYILVSISGVAYTSRARPASRGIRDGGRRDLGQLRPFFLPWSASVSLAVGCPRR